MGVVILVQVPMQRETYYVNRAFLGLDFVAFYDAAARIREGRNPYEVSRFVTPPLPAFAAIPATYLPFELASAVMSGLVPLLLMASFITMNRTFLRDDRRSYDIILACGAFTFLFGYSFVFLYDRGNVDGFVALFLCAGLCLVDRANFLAGLLLAAAVSFKLYPVLVVLPLMLAARWRLLTWVGVYQLGFMLISPALWLDFVNTRLGWRAAEHFAIKENASLYNVFHFLGRFAEKWLGPARAELETTGTLLAHGVYGLLLASCLYADYRRRNAWTRAEDHHELVANAALYFPFMVAVPKVSYAYTLVVVLVTIPAWCYLWGRSKHAWERRWIAVMAVGAALGQAQAVALSDLLGTDTPYFLPPFGLFVVLIGATAYKWVAKGPEPGNHI